MNEATCCFWFHILVLIVSICCTRSYIVPFTSRKSLPSFQKRHATVPGNFAFDDDDDDDFFHNSWNDNEEATDSLKAPNAEPPSPLQPANVFYSKKAITDFQPSSPQLFQQLCRKAGITRPSKIQSLSWPLLLEGQTAIVADQTGSGKTLAYLLPLLHRAMLDDVDVTKKSKFGAPRVVVLAPTAELADQTRRVCDRLQVESMVLTATGQYATSIRDQIRLLQRRPVDVLIATPGRLATILRTKNSGLDMQSRLKAIVLDEVDVLMSDDTFGPQLRTLAAAAPVANIQFVFCTATLPDEIVQTVKKEFPDIQAIRGPGLHRVALTVKEKLVDVSVPASVNRDSRRCFDIKAQELRKALRENKCQRTLVFCNTVESCRQVENLLRRSDRRGNLYQIYAYHNAMTPEARHESLDLFCKHDPQAKGRNESILVCTDRAARGVDFEQAPVDHVVLFDFPKDPAEYVRRVGRTARAGRKGVSTVLAYGWQLPIARSIMGKKLEETKSLSDSGDYEDPEDEYRGGVKGRRKRSKGDHSIRKNIEDGKLWS